MPHLHTCGVKICNYIMMKNTLRNSIVLTLIMTLVIACGGDDKSDAGNFGSLDKNTPDGAFLMTMDALAKSDLQEVVKNSLSQENYNELVSEFEANKSKPMSAEQKDQFNQAIVVLNDDNAEENIYKMVEPQLTQVRAFMPMMLMAGKEQIAAQLGSSSTPLATRCNSNAEVVDATVTWIMDNDILQADKVRDSIGELVAMGRKININSAEELQSMSFDEALNTGSIAFDGLKRMLKAHGIDSDKILRSAQVSDVNIVGEEANMISSYEVFGKTLCAPVTMIKRDGFWVIKSES